MSEASPAPPTVLRGWYQDPSDSLRDRWWDGSSWTNYTHRSASLRRSMFGSQYARSFWAGPNRAAGRSLLFARIGMIVLLVAVIGALLDIQAGGVMSYALGIGFVLLLGGTAVLAIIGMVNGIFGIRAARARGAIILAIWGLCASALLGAIAIPTAIGLIAVVSRA